VVKSLLAAFEGATATPNQQGELPLHLACRYNASVSVLKELCKAHPAASLSRTIANATAINVLCQAQDTTETNHVNTNSSALWHRRKDDLQEVNYKSIFYQKIQILLEAVATHRQTVQNQSTNTLYIVHAAVSLEQSCPLQVLDYALYKYPEQVSQRDGTGRLPLHIAVAAVLPNANTAQSLRKFQPKENQLTCKLLEQYPQAAQQLDPNGRRFPLHTALQNLHEWHAGVKEIYQHAPDAVLERDSNVLEVLVGRLRKKLDPDRALNPVETLRGRGYRFRLPRTNA